MKTFSYRRHGKKDGENISKEGLKEATQLGENELESLDYVVGGELSRTWQTATAFVAGCRGISNEILPPIAEFGSNDVFNAWKALPNFNDVLKANGRNFLKTLRQLMTFEDFSKTLQWALGGVKKVFDQMDENTTAVGFGHTPVIEMAASALLGYDLENICLQELEGLEFVRDDKGVITVNLTNILRA